MYLILVHIHAIKIPIQIRHLNFLKASKLSLVMRILSFKYSKRVFKFSSLYYLQAQWPVTKMSSFTFHLTCKIFLWNFIWNIVQCTMCQNLNHEYYTEKVCRWIALFKCNFVCVSCYSKIAYIKQIYVKERFHISNNLKLK